MTPAPLAGLALPMALPLAAWIDLTHAHWQRWHHLAWFAYGCVEREHHLTLRACMAGWPPCHATTRPGTAPNAAAASPTRPERP